MWNEIAALSKAVQPNQAQESFTLDWKTKMNVKLWFKKWICGASIPVPPACKADELPIVPQTRMDS